jgi:hypothetical protein
MPFFLHFTAMLVLWLSMISAPPELIDDLFRSVG